MFWLGGIFWIVFLVVIGFVILHFAEKEKSLNLKIAGYVLIGVGGLLALYAVIMMATGSMPFGTCGRTSHGGMMGSGHGMMSGHHNMSVEMKDAMHSRMKECAASMNGKTMNEASMQQMHNCMLGNSKEENMIKK